MPSVPAGRQPGDPGEGGTPGTGPNFPGYAAPPSGGALDVSAAELKRYSQLFTQTGQQVEAVSSKLDSVLAQLEAKIGDDETGAAFKKEYLPARTNVMMILERLTQFLDGVQEGLVVTAQNYEKADDIAADGVQVLWNG